MHKRIWKSPFLWCGILGLLFLLAGAVFIGKGNEPGIGSKRDIFDNNQYLFAEQSKIPVSVDLNIIEGAVLGPTAPPFLLSGNVLGALGGLEPVPKKEITQYIVQSGDNLSSIASQFNISLETMLLANNLSTGSVLKVGQKLVILPVSGLMHIVMQGDTVSELAELYKAKVEDIVDFNGIGKNGAIYAGDLLVIPGGKKPKNFGNYVKVPLSQSYFICPIPSPCRLTQGLHWFNAIDFSNGKCGEPVYAAAGGTVQRTGFTALGGNYVRILHPNGVVTYYGHLSKITASAQEKVYQGQIIGHTGYSGVTVPRGPAGCHLHFDVRFAKNPFARFAVGTELGK